MIKQIILITLFLAFAIGEIIVANNIDLESRECSTSKYNVYSNSTQAMRFFDYCFVPVYRSYETNKECGTFGISCYEASRSHTVVVGDKVCFNRKTGGKCS